VKQAVPVKQSGFTLLEVLVALATAALLAVAMNRVLDQSVQGAERAARIESEAERQRLLLGVARLIASALPAPAGQAALAWRGSPQDCEFVAVPPQAATAAGPLRVRLASEPDGEGLRLVLTLKPLHDGAAVVPALGRWVLAEGLRTLSFSYHPEAVGTTQAPAAALQRWADTGTLPVLFEVRGEPLARGAPVLHLAARPRVRLAMNCELDSVSAACRP
jgi:prepilin-type N-terminal cleavage/methylation domain-containing protein